MVSSLYHPPCFMILLVGWQCWCSVSTYHQRKLGSNTSVLRTNRILRLEMMKGGARLRLDLEGWCAIQTWPWWRVVWDFTWHNNTSHWDLTLMKGGVREVLRKGSGDEGKGLGWEVVTKGSGDRREVVTKGSGYDGKCRGREVVRRGSGDKGKWWRMHVARADVVGRKPELETVCFSV